MRVAAARLATLVGASIHYGFITSPAAWGVVAFCVFFSYAGFARVTWNAVELIIAQHLIDYQVYATSLDYPSAVTWRPVFSTFIVTVLRLITDDPVLIYQLFCGSAVAALTASLFLAAQRLAGTSAGHLAAGLTLACPAVTTTLIDHPHSYAHVGAMLILGPVILQSVRLLAPSAEGSRSTTAYAGTGLLYGLAYLSRSEMLLFAVLFAAALTYQHTRHGLSRHRLAAFVLAFAVPFAAYNVHASAAARRDGLVARKTIYTFYASQGWTDPPPNSGPDLEEEGYVYALALYGDPVENGESVLTAIGRNPEAFMRRLSLNASRFYKAFREPAFFSATWSLAALVGLAAALLGLAPAGARRSVLFLAGLVAATHFVLLFHIDARYLTLTAPPLLVLAACAGGWTVDRLRPRGRFAVIGAQAALWGLLAWTAQPQLAILGAPREADRLGIVGMEAMGRHFRNTVTRPVLVNNREPHILCVWPAVEPVRPEDAFLLAYFSGTAWTNSRADGVFPRGQLYSYRDREYDYVYVPVAKIGDYAGLAKRIVAEHHNPVFGPYYLASTH